MSLPTCSTQQTATPAELAQYSHYGSTDLDNNNTFIQFDIHFWNVTHKQVGVVEEAQVKLQVEVLNHYFASAYIGFNFGGLQTIDVSAKIGLDALLQDKEAVRNTVDGLKKEHRVANKLNVYIVPLQLNHLGWATLPLVGEDHKDVDGVVVNYNTLPGSKVEGYQHNKGKTLVHQLGHWFGLFHTFHFRGDTAAPDDDDNAWRNLMNCATDNEVDHFTQDQCVRMRRFAWGIRTHGASPPSTKVIPRKSVNQLTQDEKKVVYRAMHLIQQPGPNGGDSPFWTLALIHKLHCQHRSILFLGWHREYILQFEQALQAALKADGYADAATFRLPYFDVTDKTTGPKGLPSFFTVPKVVIDLGTKKGVEINNPVLNYTFEHDTEYALMKPYQLRKIPKGSVTDRGPQDKFLANWTDSYSSVLTNIGTCMKSTEVTDFYEGALSSNTAIENPHNDIHGMIGGAFDDPGTAWSNTMTLIEISSFDPIFYFHHCNIDRLYFEWQKAHPSQSLSATVGDTKLPPWDVTAQSVDVLYRPPSTIGYTPGSFATISEHTPTAVVGHLNVTSTFSISDLKRVVVSRIDVTKMCGSHLAQLYGRDTIDGPATLLGKSLIFCRANPEGCINCIENGYASAVFIIRGNPKYLDLKFISYLNRTVHSAHEFGEFKISVTNLIVPH